eukprot:3937216-Rhodomonas_salina.1
MNRKSTVQTRREERKRRMETKKGHGGSCVGGKRGVSVVHVCVEDYNAVTVPKNLAYETTLLLPV